MIEYRDLYNKDRKHIIKTKLFLPEINESNNNIFILCHGFCSSKESDSVGIIAQKLNEEKIPAIAFDFPGHGESEETTKQLTVENCISYINTIERYIKEKFNNPNISIFAVSFGAYITINKIIKEDKNDFKNIVLRSPAIDMKNILVDSLIKEDFLQYKKNGKAKAGFGGKIEVPYSFYEDLCKNDILELYNRDDNLLIFQGVEDDTSPIEDTYKFIKNNPRERILIQMEGVKHKMTQNEIEKVAKMMLKKIQLR